jgi:hypothetical protein
MQYFILLIIVSIISVCFVYIDGRFNDKNKTNMDYVKQLVYSNLLVVGFVYCLKLKDNVSLTTDLELKGGQLMYNKPPNF